MNTYWSSYVQRTEELYDSRSHIFHDGTKDLWLKALGISEGMKILDVGCAGGLFCHRIKKYVPSAEVTGIDLDTGHIAFAQSKAAQLGLDCTFLSGDACNLPFEDDTFDVTFSHTVINFCETDSFFREQRRVLKPGGRMVIVCVANNPSGPEGWVPDEEGEEKELFDRLWSEADKSPLSNIKRYEGDKNKYFGYFEKYGFCDISVDAFAVVTYAPDSANVSEATAVSQINSERLSELHSVDKARLMAPDALNDGEYGLLLELINKKFDKRLSQYHDKQHKWDINIATRLGISGIN